MLLHMVTFKLAKSLEQKLRGSALIEYCHYDSRTSWKI